MRKQEQIEINNKCCEAWGKACEEWLLKSTTYKARLRSCSADVYEGDNYYFLKSYNTLIAVIDKNTDTLYDMLRLVYGYTSTSAQHVAKFRKDYGAGMWGCEHEYRYYPV